MVSNASSYRVTPDASAAVESPVDVAATARYAIWLVAVVVAALPFLIPFIWMLSSSLKVQAQVFTFPPQWIPSPFEWANYAQVWQVQPLLLFFSNTLIVVVLGGLGDIISSSLVAFGFARLRFRWRDVLFMVLLSTIMLPMHVTLIPQFLLFSWLGWVNTLAPLIVPYWFGFPLHVFLLRQFLLSISYEIDDAAKIDGASYFDIYYRIAMPLMKPALAVVGVFAITQLWTEFTQPLIYLSTKDHFTISLGLRAFQTEDGLLQVHLMMAMATLAILPLVIMFLLGQRLFIQGVVLQGMH